MEIKKAIDKIFDVTGSPLNVTPESKQTSYQLNQVLKQTSLTNRENTVGQRTVTNIQKIKLVDVSSQSKEIQQNFKAIGRQINLISGALKDDDKRIVKLQKLIDEKILKTSNYLGMLQSRISSLVTSNISNVVDNITEIQTKVDFHDSQIDNLEAEIDMLKANAKKDSLKKVTPQKKEDNKEKKVEVKPSSNWIETALATAAGVAAIGSAVALYLKNNKDVQDWFEDTFVNQKKRYWDKDKYTRSIWTGEFWEPKEDWMMAGPHGRGKGRKDIPSLEEYKKEKKSQDLHDQLTKNMRFAGFDFSSWFGGNKDKTLEEKTVPINVDSYKTIDIKTTEDINIKTQKTLKLQADKIILDANTLEIKTNSTVTNVGQASTTQDTSSPYKRALKSPFSQNILRQNRNIKSGVEVPSLWNRAAGALGLPMQRDPSTGLVTTSLGTGGVGGGASSPGKEVKSLQEPFSGGAAGANKMGGVNDKLVESISQGAIRAFGDPNDPNTRYVVDMQGGVRPGSPRHTPGLAVDLQIYDRQKKQYIGGSSDIMKNAYDNPETYRMYEVLNQARYQYMLEKYGKETADKMSWGGRFWARQGAKSHGSAFDSMHSSISEGSGKYGKIYEPGNETVQNWLKKWGAAPSEGMGNDPLKWKSPFANEKISGVSTPSQTVTGENRVDQIQGKEASIRKGAITQTLQDQLNIAAQKNNVRVEVVSGGQRMEGAEGHTGSHRHDHGNAADLKLYTTDAQGNKKYLDFSNDNDRAIMQKFLSDSVAAGATGIGAAEDYMGTKTMHIGGGDINAWGAKGSSAKAPEWVKQALATGLNQRNTNIQPESTPTIKSESTPTIKGRKIDRSKFAEQLKDPRVRAAFAGRINSEVGSQGPEAQLAFAEEVFNRATARNQTLMQALSGSYYPTRYPGYSDNPAYLAAIDLAATGVDTTNAATGNASGRVGFGYRRGDPRNIGQSIGGERFQREAKDINWQPKYINPKSSRYANIMFKDRMAAAGIKKSDFIPKAKPGSTAFFGGDRAKPKMKSVGVVQKTSSHQDYVNQKHKFTVPKKEAPKPGSTEYFAGDKAKSTPKTSPPKGAPQKEKPNSTESTAGDKMKTAPFKEPSSSMPSTRDNSTNSSSPSPESNGTGDQNYARCLV